MLGEARSNQMSRRASLELAFDLEERVCTQMGVVVEGVGDLVVQICFEITNS